MNEDRVVYSTEEGRLDSGKADGGKRRSNRQGRRLPPSAPGVRIHRQRKGRGGKCVSIVTGLELPEAELKEILKQWKQRLGTGGAIRQGCIEIQGDRREQLLALLRDAGYSAKISGG